MYRILLLLCLLTACTAPEKVPVDPNQNIARAEKTLGEERQRLQTMQDSLPVKIEQNVRQLGLTPEQADALERPLIAYQEAVVAAAERNLEAQRALRDSLQKYGP